MTKVTKGGDCAEDKRGATGPKGPIAAVRSKHILIQWPTEEELDEVSRQLRQIHQIGVSSEADGDCFKSGDVAYQLREILRTTSELLKKSQRRCVHQQ